MGGLLLVTGPFALNGVPLRRMGQRFVIITSTKIEGVDKMNLEAVDDAFFMRKKKDKKKGPQKLPKEKKTVMLAVDNELLALVEAHPEADIMKPYLRAFWTIVPGQPPHAIKF